MSVDLTYFLTERIGFIQSFYKTSAEPLELTKHQIEAGEEPYKAPFSDDGGEPPFTSEWIDAQEKLDVLGFCCLSLLQGALKAYLKDYIDRIGEAGRLDIWKKVGEFKKKNGWFDQYGSFLRSVGIDWSKSDADLALIEQITFVRNDFMHADDLGTTAVYQSKEHFRRFPVPTFAHELDAALWAEDPEEEAQFPARLRISAKKLTLAISEVRKFCRWLEDQWRQLVGCHA